jgi:uncharacterized protein with ACT and thioredoxin-like domain
MITPKKTEYKIACQERIGLLKDISSIVSRNHISIVKLETFFNEKYPFVRLVIGTDNIKKAESIMLKIRQVEGVKEISYRIVD